MKKQLILTILCAVTALWVLSDGLPANEANPEPEPAVKKYVRANQGPGRAGAKDAPYNMVLVPKGDVVLGLNKETVEELGGGQMESLTVLSASMPRHKVRSVSEFYCDKYEVTNAQWKIFLDATGRQPSELLRTISWKDGPDGGSSYPEGEENFPIRNVELREAKAFAAWCGKRLPTEVEWMRAAAGDDGRMYPWGDKWDPKLCITKDRRTRQPKLVETGSLDEGASPFGIEDMAGSVTEWTVSTFQAYERFQPISIKIGRRKEMVDPRFDARWYVAKGGFYLGNDVTNLLAVRHAVPGDTNFNTLGFRCVKSPGIGKDIFDAAVSHLNSSYIEDGKWDRSNFYAVEVSEVDSEKRLIVSSDHLVFAPMSGILTSISKIYRNENPTPNGFFPLAVLSVSRPLEEPNLPAGAYTLVYRHKGGGADVAEGAAEKPAAPEEKEKPAAKEEEGKKEDGKEEEGKEEDEKKKEDGEKKEGEEEKKKTAEEIAQEEEDKRIAEENRKAKERAEAENEKARKELEKIGATVTAQKLGDLPTSRDLILFLNSSDDVVGYVEVEPIREGGEEPIRIVHVDATGMTDIEFSVRILGSKHPRFSMQIKVRDNPFGN